MGWGHGPQGGGLGRQLPHVVMLGAVMDRVGNMNLTNGLR